MKMILLVEDDELLRDLYAHILLESGFTVETAKDGEEGIEKASKGGFDIVLLDIMMPKIDGIGVLKHLKHHPPAKKNGKIVMLTVLREDRYLRESMENGADSYIVKSELTPQQIVEQVNTMLKP